MAQARSKTVRTNPVLTPEEAKAYFDAEAHRRLGMSGDEFVRAWEAGEFDDDPDRPAVIALEMMLPFYYDAGTPADHYRFRGKAAPPRLGAHPQHVAAGAG